MRSPQSVTWPYGLGLGGRDLNKKSLLNCGNPAQAGQASCVINICKLTDGYSHCVREKKESMVKFMNSRLWISSSFVDVLEQVPQEPQIQPMVTPVPDDDISDEDFTVINSSSPSAGPPPSAEQRARSRRDERSRSRERVPPHLSSHASQQPQPVVLLPEFSRPRLWQLRA